MPSYSQPKATPCYLGVQPADPEVHRDCWNSILFDIVISGSYHKRSWPSAQAFLGPGNISSKGNFICEMYRLTSHGDIVALYATAPSSAFDYLYDCNKGTP